MYSPNIRRLFSQSGHILAPGANALGTIRHGSGTLAHLRCMTSPENHGRLLPDRYRDRDGHVRRDTSVDSGLAVTADSSFAALTRLWLGALELRTDLSPGSRVPPKWQPLNLCLTHPRTASGESI